MGGSASKSTSSGLDVSSSVPAVTPAAESKTKDVSTASKNRDPAVTPAAESKPKKKICCACPETKKLRDECIVEHGESACAKWIEAHRACLRAEGFNV